MESAELEPEGHQEFEQVARQIAQDQTAFDDNVYAQETQAMQLRGKWQGLGDQDRKTLLAKFALLFPRCRENANPQECLRKIIELPSHEDVQRALRVRAGDYVGFRSDPGEEIYPTTGWFGRYLDYARWNKVPLALHFWASASILGVAVRRNYFVDNNVNYVWMNQFIVLSGPKGNGKSAARSIAKSVLYRMNRKIAEMEEAKPQKIVSAGAFQIPMIASDITPEDIVKQLADWSAFPRYLERPPILGKPAKGEAVAIIICDELSNLLGKSTYNAAKRIPLFTELCFEDHYSKSTVAGGKMEIERMAFSILACTQPGWMRDTIVGDAKEGGFVERVNFIHRPKSGRKYSFLEIPIIDPLQAEKLAEDLLPLSMKTSDPQLLQPTKQAKVFFTRWYDSQYEKGPLDLVEAEKHSLDRRCIHTLRLASLLCISEGETVPWLQDFHLAKALEIIEAEDEYLPQFMAQANEGNLARDAREMVTWLKSQGGSCTKTQYNQASRFKGWGRERRANALAELFDTREVEQKHEGRAVIYKVVTDD